MIYAISDIHGYYSEMHRRFDQLGNLSTFTEGQDKLILLGDYIDYGPDSFKVLDFIFSISLCLGSSMVVLRGNHEESFLEWLNLYSRPNAGKPDEFGFVDWNGWLQDDAKTGFGTFRTFLTREQWEHFQAIALTASELDLNIEAARMILSSHRELIGWLRKLPYYYETERQIFVHAGVDETYPTLWRDLTERYVFVEKFPAATGKFYKDIIAGHVGAAAAAGNPEHEGVYFDGASHYYIDGSVQRTSRLLCLAYDEQSGRYYELLRAEHPNGIHGRIYGELKPL